MKEPYKSRVYTDRPDYADFDPPAKFEAIKSIIAKRLTEHPKAICSYSGGSDSDILIDLIERTRRNFGLPPIKYVFFNTGLEMKATKDHVKAVAEKYGVEIQECRPKVNIVTASRKYGIPFVSKIMSAGLEQWQKKGVPLSIAEEYNAAEDKAAKRRELDAARKRITELSAIFKRLYEDSVAGRISDERFMELSAEYEREQAGLKDRACQLEAELAKARDATVNVERFMNVVRKYTSFEELTPTLLREFIEKIVVHEPYKDEKGIRRQDIEIYYSFVGKVDLPD